MDPSTLILQALLSGAVAGIKPTAEKVVKDTYGALKLLVGRVWKRLAEGDLEKNPSPETVALYQQELKRTGVDKEETVVELAQELTKLVEKHDPAALGVVRLNLGKIVSKGSVKIEEVTAGSSVDIATGDISADQDVRIGGIRAGSEKPNP